MKSSTAQAKPGDVVTLSTKLIQVAMYLDAPLTWKQIATRLRVPYVLYKARAKNLYLALGVHNRIEAAARWEALGA